MKISIPDEKLKLKNVTGNISDNLVTLISKFFYLDKDEVRKKMNQISWEGPMELTSGSMEIVLSDMSSFICMLETFEKDKNKKVSFVVEGDNNGEEPEFIQPLIEEENLSTGSGKELINEIERFFDLCRDFRISNNLKFITSEVMLYEISKYKSFEDTYTELGGNIDGLKNDLLHYMHKQQTFKQNGFKEKDYNDIGIPEMGFYTEWFHSILPTYIMISNKQEAVTAFEIQQTIQKPKHDIVSYIISYILSYKCPANSLFLQNIGFTPRGTFEKDMKRIFLLWKKTICKHIPSDDAEFIKHVQIYFSWINTMQRLYKEYESNQNTDGEPITKKNSHKEWERYMIPLKKDTCQFVGREKEINEIIEILCRKNNANPLLIGENGTGLTSIIYGIEKRIKEGNVPENLVGRNIYRLDSQAIATESGILGSIEGRMGKVIKECSKQNAILFIDDIYAIGADSPSGGMIITSLIHHIQSNKATIIATASTQDFQSLKSDTSFFHCFTKVNISPMDKQDTLKILSNIMPEYENHHRILVSQKLLEYITDITDYHMRNENFPLKAVNIFDMTLAHAKMKGKTKATKEDVAEVVARQINGTKEMIAEDENSILLSLPKKLKEKVIGQEKAIDKIYDSVLIAKAGLKEPNKPIASLLFVGPTGVGKTFLAQQLSDMLHIPLIKKDMSEYSEAHNVSRLFGSPPGYVGCETGGQLIKEIQENPFCVLLLDEIEKAHPNVFDVFLQVMDDARLTDGNGDTADFHNVILIMTSNCGVSDALRTKPGFGGSLIEYSESEVENSVKKTFRPEFRNRLDQIVYFNPISMEMAERITRNKLKELSERSKMKGIRLEYDESAVKEILNQGYSKEYGARNIERIIQHNVYMPLSRGILFNRQDKHYILKADQGKVIVEKQCN